MKTFTNIKKVVLAISILLMLIQPALYAGKHTRGNRFAYLDSREVWYPDLSLPKFITAQWIDEPNIEAAVILSMDDMAKTEPFHEVLEPVFAHLKQLCNGKSPYSIFSNRVDPNHYLFQQMINDDVCDSSLFNIFTDDDPQLDRESVIREDGKYPLDLGEYDIPELG